MNYKTEIIKTINQISGKYSAHEVFSDWVRTMALSISNATDMIHGDTWLSRECIYSDTMKKYDEEEQTEFQKMFVWLAETLEEGIDDVLGAIYMGLDMGHSSTGQFFTPFHISELTAATTLDIPEIKENDEMITLNEPSCGGGGMIIAVAKILHDSGINYQKRMKVIAQDLDWNCVYMCYVQLSLLGIDAICIQGNTLTDKSWIYARKSKRLRTPKNMGMML